MSFWAEGTDGYTIVQIDAQSLGTLPGNGIGNYGPFGMDGGGFLALHEIELAPGTVNENSRFSLSP